ncbi:protein NinF [Salmonella enterica subsp. enterica serovar Infantis]|nr:hypothetical protein [Salmonella enterica]EJP6360699.1 hypothetical protein [Salmonella enterica]ELI3776552.1 hypothetical protein [Salmonella enterica]EMB9759362.1 hypothetical protein [Salmonella enterica]
MSDPNSSMHEEEDDE